ncbi:MAG: hypothetical protein Q4G00_17165 [Clostridia bacterium]|nr:hypothetical protein [Clostridia bacterium]
MSRQIINTNIRLNLEREEDRRAWEYLQGMDRKQYKSYTRAVVAAINDYFGRQMQLAEDPYLETREKEDAFLQKVLETIEKGMAESKQDGLLSALLALQNGALAHPQEQEKNNASEEDLNAALDFLDSF